FDPDARAPPVAPLTLGERLECVDSVRPRVLAESEKDHARGASHDSDYLRRTWRHVCTRARVQTPTRQGGESTHHPTAIDATGRSRTRLCRLRAVLARAAAPPRRRRNRGQRSKLRSAGDSARSAQSDGVTSGAGSAASGGRESLAKKSAASFFRACCGIRNAVTTARPAQSRSNPLQTSLRLSQNSRPVSLEKSGSASPSSCSASWPIQTNARYLPSKIPASASTTASSWNGLPRRPCAPSATAVPTTKPIPHAEADPPRREADRVVRPLDDEPPGDAAPDRGAEPSERCRQNSAGTVLMKDACLHDSSSVRRRGNCFRLARHRRQVRNRTVRR